MKFLYCHHKDYEFPLIDVIKISLKKYVKAFLQPLTSFHLEYRLSYDILGIKNWLGFRESLWWNSLEQLGFYGRTFK
jgi:hypothetical protein